MVGRSRSVPPGVGSGGDSYDSGCDSGFDSGHDGGRDGDKSYSGGDNDVEGYHRGVPGGRGFTNRSGGGGSGGDGRSPSPRSDSSHPRGGSGGGGGGGGGCGGGGDGGDGVDGGSGVDEAPPPSLAPRGGGVTFDWASWLAAHSPALATEPDDLSAAADALAAAGVKGPRYLHQILRAVPGSPLDALRATLPRGVPPVILALICAAAGDAGLHATSEGSARRGGEAAVAALHPPDRPAAAPPPPVPPPRAEAGEVVGMVERVAPLLLPRWEVGPLQGRGPTATTTTGVGARHHGPPATAWVSLTAVAAVAANRERQQRSDAERQVDATGTPPSGGGGTTSMDQSADADMTRRAVRAVAAAQVRQLARGPSAAAAARALRWGPFGARRVGRGDAAHDEGRAAPPSGGGSPRADGGPTLP
ncbi:hypothetical protein MMPV_004651 [Pyropia vietnamensis]